MKLQVTLTGQTKTDMQRELINDLREKGVIGGKVCVAGEVNNEGEEEQASERIALERMRLEYECRKMEIEANKEVELRKLKLGVYTSPKKEL